MKVLQLHTLGYQVYLLLFGTGLCGFRIIPWPSYKINIRLTKNFYPFILIRSFMFWLWCIPRYRTLRLSIHGFIE
jgi:hypothetical protein